MAQKPAWYSVKNEGGNPEIKIYGFISAYDEDSVSYVRFQNELRMLAASNPEVTIRFHCYGGSMFDGLPIYDLIRNCKAKIITINEGMAASMGSVLFEAGTVRKMFRHARLMIHRPSGSAYGESEDMRNYADLMDSLEKDITNIFMKRTGKSEKIVKAWMQPKTDKWITAEEALKLGLCDEIIDDEGTEPNVPDNAWTDGKTPEGVWGICNALTNSNDSNFDNSDMKKPIISVLNAYKVEHNLTDTNTDQQFADAVENALKVRDEKIQELQGKLDTQSENQVKSLVDSAVSSGKITEADRERYTKLAKADYTTTGELLNGMQARVDVNASLKRGEKKEEGEGDERKTWNYRDYETKDPKALAKIRTEEPDRFKKLMDDYYSQPAD